MKSPVFDHLTGEVRYTRPRLCHVCFSCGDLCRNLNYSFLHLGIKQICGMLALVEELFCLLECFLVGSAPSPLLDNI